MNKYILTKAEAPNLLSARTHFLKTALCQDPPNFTRIYQLL